MRQSTMVFGVLSADFIEPIRKAAETAMEYESKSRGEGIWVMRWEKSLKIASSVEHQSVLAMKWCVLQWPPKKLQAAAQFSR